MDKKEKKLQEVSSMYSCRFCLFSSRHAPVEKMISYLNNNRGLEHVRLQIFFLELIHFMEQLRCQ